MTVVVLDSLIEAILPRSEARRIYPQAGRIERHDAVLIPGLVNAHVHNPMTLMRGLADDLPLKQWLEGHIWPTEAKLVDAQFCRDGVELAVAEMLRGGTTACTENYFFPDACGDTYERLGFRACVGLPVIRFPTSWAADSERYFERAAEVHERFAASPLVSTAFAPHAPYTVDDADFERIADVSARWSVPVHCHIHETQHEVDDAVAASGERPLARLDRLGLVNERLVAVHMTALIDAEIELIATRQAVVVHCPESNLKLASGFCPVAKLHRAGARLAIGTDGCASNNDLDMFGEMRLAALLAKAVANDAAAVDAATCLRMATLGGAAALGLSKSIGSIEVGKQADLAVVSLEAIELQPMYDPASQLVYAGGRQFVRDAFVAGRPRLRDFKLVDFDEAGLRARVASWRDRAAPFASPAAVALS